MTKKEIARLFNDSFSTKIEEVITTGELKGSGGTVEQRRRGEVVFRNHSEYGKREFSNDYRNFAKKLGNIYGIDWHEIKRPVDRKGRYKSFCYQWDPEQVIEIDGIKFRMSRRMIDKPHAVIDGCTHTLYVDIDDLELVEEIKKLNDERIAAIEQKKKDDFPADVAYAKTQCREMVEDLTKILNGEIEMTEDSIKRINNAYFEICVMVKG